MKKIIFLMFLLTFMLFAVDVKIPVQGFLTDNNGIELTGEQTVKFTLYDLDEDGNVLWSEEANITLNNGNFSYMLGTTNFIDSTVLENGTPLYLGVKIDDEVLSPRIEIGVESKAIFAYKADNASKLEGKTLAEVKADTLGDILARLEALEAAKTTLETDIANLKTANIEKDAKILALETANTEKDAEITALKTKVADLESDNTLFSGALENIQAKLNFITVTQNVNLDSMENTISSLQRGSTMQSSAITALQTKTESMSVITDNEQPTVRFTGVNVQIVSGSGSTDGDVNGKGNLIVGYNEATGMTFKTGSHNLIVGKWHSYSSYGGMVVGEQNTISNKFSSVSAGSLNKATGEYSSVSGGWYNTASGEDSSISGGKFNQAIGTQSSITGGENNETTGQYSSISGGNNNTASGTYSSVSAGEYNIASGDYSSVSAGVHNTASKIYSSVSGGFGNKASMEYSSVSGGKDREADGMYDWVAGGLFQDN